MKLNYWTEAEIARMNGLRGSGKNWDAVAAEMPGRTPGACMVAFYNAKAKLVRQTQRDRVARPAPKPVLPPKPPPLVCAVQPKPPPPEYRCGTTSTDVLRTDAELRSRIAERGITGGLLGDPAPGRSALDEMRAGNVEPAGRRDWRMGPRVTLAGEP